MACMDIPPRCSTLFMVVVDNELIRLVVLAMVETIERRATEHSSALARHAAIIMKSLMNLLVEVVNQCSTLGIDIAEQLFGLGTRETTLKIHAVCITGVHRLHIRCRPRSSRRRARIVEAFEALELLMSRLRKTSRRLQQARHFPET